ncbi:MULTISPECIES: PH domain-containing protein [Clostridium]|uniref:PH domain-containing protein n=1 Tax=Clostridium TaxID=1485 RepID=UPI0008250DF3|nr:MULTISPECIES: PH domain-containing protein [Clostridium]PJI10112.1 hypothetical protein CUB90_20545 [Clostridium sp. CT7]
MPTLEQIKEQMKKANVTNTFCIKDEINTLPKVLMEDEEIKYLTSCVLDGHYWLAACTNKRVLFLYRTGFFELKQKEIQLEQINSISQQSGYASGDLEIGYGVSKIIMEGVSEKAIKLFIDAVNIAKEELKNKSGHAEVKQESIPQQIKELAELKDSGILTEEEFSQKKSELLARM